MATRKHTTLAFQLDLPLPGAQGELSLVYPHAEEWRAVVGYEGLYEVSSFGRVRALKRRVINKRGDRIIYMVRKAMIMRPTLLSPNTPQQTLRVNLGKDGIKKAIPVQILVMNAFVGPRPPGLVCHHIDGNRLNNALTNLAWVTQSYNVQDGWDRGRQAPRGEQRYNAVLTDDLVRAMRQSYAEGMKIMQIAKAFAIDRCQVSRVVHKRTWAHVAVDQEGK